jgi:hypothetical protein
MSGTTLSDAQIQNEEEIYGSLSRSSSLVGLFSTKMITEKENTITKNDKNSNIQQLR